MTPGHNGGPPLEDPRQAAIARLQAEIRRLEESARVAGGRQAHAARVAWGRKMGESRLRELWHAAIDVAQARRQAQIARLERKIARLEGRAA